MGSSEKRSFAGGKSWIWNPTSLIYSCMFRRLHCSSFGFLICEAGLNHSITVLKIKLNVWSANTKNALETWAIKYITAFIFIQVWRTIRSFAFFFFVFCLFRAAPMTYGGSQARGSNRAIAASIHHSHSNATSELRLQPTPQLMAMPDP